MPVHSSTEIAHARRPSGAGHACESAFSRATIDPPSAPARPVQVDTIFAAAQALLPVLEAGKPLDAATKP